MGMLRSETQKQEKKKSVTLHKWLPQGRHRTAVSNDRWDEESRSVLGTISILLALIRTKQKGHVWKCVWWGRGTGSGGGGGGLRHQYLMVTCLLGHARAPGSGPSICLFAGAVFPVLHSFSSTERARGWWNISPLGFCTAPSSRCSRSRGGELGWEKGGGEVGRAGWGGSNRSNVLSLRLTSLIGPEFSDSISRIVSKRSLANRKCSFGGVLLYTRMQTSLILIRTSCDVKQ